MNKNRNIILFVIIGIVILGLIGFFLAKPQGKQFNWRPTFSHDKTQPYDFSLFQQLLKENYEFERMDEHVISKKLAAADDMQNEAYIFVGHYPYHTEEAAEALKKFARQGGQVLLICTDIPDSLLNSLLDEDDCQDNLLQLNRMDATDIPNIYCEFTHPTLRGEKYPFSFKSGAKDTSEYFWGYIAPYYICDESQYPFATLGNFGVSQSAEANYPNFVRAKVGEGAIYWHTNPILFSNLYLSKQTGNAGFDYLNHILSHLRAKHLIWDHASTKSPRPDFDHNSRQFDKPKTPMQYIFSQPALTWAWILLLSLSLLYALFGAKRRQRNIPIVEPNRNTSLEFVNTIGRLYFQQQNHRVIFEKIMQLFQSHLRRRYGIILREETEFSDALVLQIVKRADVDSKIVSDIFQEYVRLRGKLKVNYVEMSPETLNHFYTLVQRFYSAEEARKELKPMK